MQKLKQEVGKDIWIVGGGSMLHEFIEKGLVDEWIITVTPTILGDGIPLFKKHDFETRLRLKGARTFNQFTELHYETVR
jgi:dihydrofolate reductase